MIIGFDAALEFYENLENRFRYPSIDPRIIRLESKLRPLSLPFFFLYRSSSEFYFYASVLNPIVGTNFFDLETPISYGGPITNISDMTKLEKVNISFKDACLKHNVLLEFIRFIPEMNNHKTYYGKIKINRPTVIVDTRNPKFSDNFSKNLIRSVKNNKTIEISETIQTKDIEKFFEIYSTNMKVKNSRKELYLNQNFMKELVSNTDSIFFIASFDGEVIAGAVFLVSDIYCEYYLSAMDNRFRKNEPLKILVAHALNVIRARGIEKVHLGGGLTNKENDSLLLSKTRFSKNTIDFYIGWNIFLEKEYLNLGEKSDSGSIGKTDRVIFYRDNE
jgi:hypothetical protein